MVYCGTFHKQWRWKIFLDVLITSFPQEYYLAVFNTLSILLLVKNLQSNLTLKEFLLFHF